MSRKVRRVRYTLDPKGIKSLTYEEIAAPTRPIVDGAILRGADPLIMSGGRSLLAKVLKGSRAKEVLGLGLDQNPAYGYYADLTIEQITARIDWAIVHGYLKIEYDYRLPFLVYAERGWEIERETYAEELLRGFDDLLAKGPPYDMTYLKDRARDMILLLLDKVEATGDRKYIPLLEAWAEVDYRKVRERIAQVVAGIHRASTQ